MRTWRSSCKLVAAIFAAVFGALFAASAEAAADPLDLASHQVVDLSHAYGPETVYWPTSPSGFELERLAWGETEGGYFYAANSLRTAEHGGTHLDAPVHFSESGWTTEQIPLARLMGPAVVIDVSERAALDPDYRLAPDDIARFEAQHGRIERGAIVLMRTGWSARWPDVLAYMGDDTRGDASKLHFPGFGAAAAQMLIEERGVGLLGCDTASIDHGPSRDFAVHRIASAANVPALENLTNLQLLPPRGATIVALPMKIAGGTGGPTRVIAFLPR